MQVRIMLKYSESFVGFLSRWSLAANDYACLLCRKRNIQGESPQINTLKKFLSFSVAEKKCSKRRSVPLFLPSPSPLPREVK